MVLIIPTQSFAGTATWESVSDREVSNNDPLATKNTEPHMAVRVTDSNVVISSFHEGVSPENCQIYRSGDGGQTWSKITTISKVSSLDHLGDPVTTATNNGNLYVVCVEFGGSTKYLRVASSTNGGTTWAVSNGVGGTTNSLDKPWIAADSNSGSSFVNNVYLCWSDFSTNPSSIKFKRYIPFDPDTSIVTIATAGHGCNITVGPSGQVYVAYDDLLGNIKMKRNLNGGNPSNWTGPYTVGSYTALTLTCGGGHECIRGIQTTTPFRVNHFPYLSTSSDGGVHVAWMTNGGTTTLADVRYATTTTCKSSSDSCTGWGTPIKVNLDTGARDQWEPAITVSKAGNIVHISAYDRRDDTSNIFYRPYDYHCHYAPPTTTCKSTTNWSNIQISSQGNTNIDLSTFVDDYHGVTSSSVREAYSVWTDHRATPAGDYDIYADRTTT